MNKKKKKQNGFTIVELVIVIAVIGILAAILIPTFSNLVKKAKQSADQQLVYHINEAVVANEVDNLAKGKNGTEATMYDTLQALENDYGFTIEKMTPRSGNDIIWDSVTNRFALIAKDGTIVYDDPNKPSDMTNKAKMWRITEAGETLGDGYSHYLTADWTGEDPITVNTGLDVGENDDITAVTYDSSSDASAVVRTNGGTLKVIAPNGTVNHYGEAESVNVVAVANNSYHENGTVKFVEISKGRMALETGAEVSHIHINAKEDAEGNKTDVFDTIIIAKADKVEMPDFSRDDVEIATNGTLVVALQTGTEEVTSQTKLDYVWLTKQGVYEQITVSENKTEAGTNWVNTSNKPAETKTAAQQIANNIGTTATVGETTYDVSVNENRDIVLKETGTNNVVYTVTVEEGKTVVTTTGENPTTVEVEVVEAQPDKESVQIGATLFAGGSGTANDPWMIVDYDTFQHVTTLSWTYYAYESYYGAEHYRDWNYACNYADSFDTISDAYFKVKDGISSIDCKNWVPVFLDGNFDGNGVILNNLDKGLFDTVDGESSTIRNFTINANISVSGGVGAVVYDSGTLNLIIDSVDVHGTIIGSSWVTPYVEFGPGATATWNLTIKNCVSDATLVATSGVASGFVGHPYNKVSQGDLTDASLITIIDSAYVGNMSATKTYNSKGVCTAATPENNSNFKYFTINGNSNRVKTYYSDKFIEKLGFNPEGTLYNTPATGYDNKGKATEVEYLVINNEDGSKTFFCGNSGKNVTDYYRPSDTTGKKAILDNTAQATLPANVGDVFTINKVSGAVKAVISLQIAPNDSNNYGSYLGTYMSEEIDISAVETSSTFTSENVRYFTINVNSGVTNETGVSGNIFNIVNSYYGKNAHNGATVKIAQFDANGNVLNITSVTIAAPHDAE